MLRSALALAVFAMPVTALAQSDDEAAQQMINDPNPATFQVYGLDKAPKSVKDDSVQGGRALPVAVTGAGQPWSVGVNVPITRAVKAGDNLQILFYAKLARAEPGITTGRIANAQLQLSSAPYTSLFGKGFDVTPEWKLFEVTGKADRDYGKGSLNAAFHINTAKQTIELGIVAVFDKGQ